MIELLSADQQKRTDAFAMELGLPSPVLMERAALAVVSEMIHRHMDLSSTCVICGSGNNGGDGAAIARILTEKGYRAEVVQAGNPDHYSAERKRQAALLAYYRVPVIEELRPERYTILVDAMFGIGLNRDVGGRYAELISQINESGLPVVSVDIPSGIHTDSGKVMGCAVKADLTVTFTREKPGILLYPGKSFCGEVVRREVGIPVDAGMKKECRMFAVGDEDFADLTPRDETGNKGTFGKLLVVAGSREMCGAAYLAAAAALRCGVGMVRIYTAEENRQVLMTLLPEALITTYRTDAWAVETLEAAVGWADSILVGPGLGTGETSGAILRAVLEKGNAEQMPVVLDADALNLISADSGLKLALKNYRGRAVVTPHLGEMARLLGVDIPSVREDKIHTAAQYASDYGVFCVLKDAVTVTAAPDGLVFINRSGCSALATAGSGDVLSGVMAALFTLFQGDNIPAMAVHMHGRLGEQAAEKYSEASVKAGDLLDEIPVFLLGNAR